MRGRQAITMMVRWSVVLGAGFGAFLGLPPSGAIHADARDVDVVVVGDSITAMNEPQIAEIVGNAGIAPVHFEALGARRIADSYEWHGWRSSGLEAIQAVHDDGTDPDLWIVELGTNDVLLAGMCGCGDRVRDAEHLIDRVLDAIGPGERVVWVTVLNRDDPDASNFFNAALRNRAAREPTMSLLDWHAVAVGHPDWFIDLVHPSRAGVAELAGMYVEAIDAAAASAEDLPVDMSGTPRRPLLRV